jgi:hypothetical protein
VNPEIQPRKLFGGTSRVEITPDGPISMGGYGQRVGLTSLGVHDPLFTKALFLTDGDQRLLVITTDLISIPVGIYARVLEALTAAGVIDEAGLCLSASHTHSGPDVDESLIIAAPVRAYLDRLVERLVLVGKQACETLVEVKLKLAVGQVDFLVNRRQRGSGNLVDPRVLAVEVDEAVTEQPLAVLFGVGCHAVCLGHDNLLISADYPGAAQRVIEQELGARNALFVNLTEGNVIPNTRPLYDSLDTRGYLGGTFEDAEKIGTALGMEVVRSLKSSAYQPLAILRTDKRLITALPTRHELKLFPAWRQMLAQRRIILEYLPEFRRASPFNLQPVFSLWRDASAVVIERNLDEPEMRRLMSAVSTFLMLAMKLASPALKKRMSFPVQTIRLNDFHLMTLPGEALVEVGRDWQERNSPHGDTAFVIGLANGFLGYLPHPGNFKEAGAEYKYETIMNALEPDATLFALEQAEQMIKT